jgi:hypothetical protein
MPDMTLMKDEMTAGLLRGSIGLFSLRFQTMKPIGRIGSPLVAYWCIALTLEWTAAEYTKDWGLSLYANFSIYPGRK